MTKMLILIMSMVMGGDDEETTSGADSRRGTSSLELVDRYATAKHGCRIGVVVDILFGALHYAWLWSCPPEIPLS